jgi:hypothetical protein
MSKLDAAIFELECMRDRVFGSSEENRESAKAAIRILEAAAKVDKNRAERLIMNCSFAYWPGSEDAMDDLRTFLESLPDEE